MNKILLSTLLFVSIILTSKAQIYTPSGTIQGTSGNNNVGIGAVPNPGEKLEINGNLKFTNNGSKIFLGFNDYIQFTDGIGDGFKFIYDDLERLRITDNGNIGVGVTNPEEKLEINGNLKFPNNGSKIFLGFNDYIQFTDGFGDGFKFIYDGLERLRITDNGNLGIGTTTPDSKLTVNGTIHATEVKVTQTVPADYVFQKYYTGESELKPDYTLLTLPEIEKFTEENHHLPNVPSAKEIKENGLHLGEMSNILLQKIEELTLYVIEQQKKLEIQQTEITKQSKEIILLKEANDSYKVITERISKLENQLKK